MSELHLTSGIVLKAFCTQPVSDLGWSFTSDQFGRLIIRMPPDPRAALGALRISAMDGSKYIGLTYQTVFDPSGDNQVTLVTSDPTTYPTFAPRNTTDCQFTRAIRIKLDDDQLDHYDLWYSGIRSYFKQHVQDSLPAVPSGTWLGRESGGADKEWLSLIDVRLTRRFSAQTIFDSLPAMPEPSAPPAD